MFDVDWILSQAEPAPESSSRRRPALLKRSMLDRPIVAAWPLGPELRRIGNYPGDGSRLDFTQPDHAIPAIVGEPGSLEWAMVVTTIEQPAVAIPLSHPETPTVRMIRVFTAPEAQRLVSVDLESHGQGRGRPRTALLGAVTLIDGDGESFIERLRGHLEHAYLAADPELRDRCLRADALPEPVVLYIAPNRGAVDDARATAATFGIGVEALPDNIALDEARLNDRISRVRDRLSAVVIWEPAGDGRLCWVADQLRARVGRPLPVERLTGPSGLPLRELIRLVLTEAATGEAWRPIVLEMPTCPRCQPAVSRIVEEEALAVGTRETDVPGDCVCERTGFQNLSIRIRFALRLADAGEVLVVGFQQNFDEALAGIRSTPVCHIRNAGEPKAAAARVRLAIVVPGSQMGHADSERYLRQLEACKVRVITTTGSQLSDVIRLLIDDTVLSRPELRAAR